MCDDGCDGIIGENVDELKSGEFSGWRFDGVFIIDELDGRRREVYGSKGTKFTNLLKFICDRKLSTVVQILQKYGQR